MRMMFAEASSEVAASSMRSSTTRHQEYLTGGPSASSPWNRRSRDESRDVQSQQIQPQATFECETSDVETFALDSQQFNRVDQMIQPICRVSRGSTRYRE